MSFSPVILVKHPAGFKVQLTSVLTLGTSASTEAGPKTATDKITSIKTAGKAFLKNPIGFLILKSIVIFFLVRSEDFQSGILLWRVGTF